MTHYGEEDTRVRATSCGVKHLAGCIGRMAIDGVWIRAASQKEICSHQGTYQTEIFADPSQLSSVEANGRRTNPRVSNRVLVRRSAFPLLKGDITSTYLKVEFLPQHFGVGVECRKNVITTLSCRPLSSVCLRSTYGRIVHKRTEKVLNFNGCLKKLFFRWEEDIRRVSLEM